MFVTTTFFTSFFTLNSQLFTGCTSSMYKTRKSTFWRNWRTFLLNFSARNSGQEQEPTRGRPEVWKSNKFRLGFLPSRHCKGTFIADWPRRAFLAMSLHRTYKRVFCISEVNIISVVCGLDALEIMSNLGLNNFCDTLEHSGIKFNSFRKAKARKIRIAKM